MSEQPQRPTRDEDRDGWKEYWIRQGMPWRTEPEIDEERQRSLDERRSVEPDIEKGIYPFRDESDGIKLTRADVEWLLATHESDGMSGPVDVDDENQRKREGLDLRGANLDGCDLRGLPLTNLIGGIGPYTLQGVLPGFEAVRLAAAIHANRALLSQACLAGAQLAFASLTGSNLVGVRADLACLRGARLDGVIACDAQLRGADLSEAFLRDSTFESLQGETRLDGADLSKAHLEDAFMNQVHLEGAFLSWAHLERSKLSGARLVGASLLDAHLEGARLEGALFVGEEKDLSQIPRFDSYGELKYIPRPVANLQDAYFDSSTSLSNAQLAHASAGSARLADVRWGGVNLATVDWTAVRMVGEEFEANQTGDGEGTHKDWWDRLYELRVAVRATRQLALTLQAQGLDEAASRFAFRARVLRRRVLWLEFVAGEQGTWARWKGAPSFIGTLLLELIAGYGYRPWRSVGTYLLVVTFFAFAYWAIGVQTGHLLTWNEAGVVSLTAFHGRGFFSTAFAPGDPQAALAAIEAIIGLLIEITFIATFTQRFFAR